MNLTPRDVDCPYCGAAPPDPCTRNSLGWPRAFRSHSARVRLALDQFLADRVARETRPYDFEAEQ